MTKEIFIYLNDNDDLGKPPFYHYIDKNFIGDTSGKYSILIGTSEYVPRRILEVIEKDKLIMWVSKKIV